MKKLLHSKIFGFGFLSLLILLGIVVFWTDKSTAPAKKTDQNNQSSQAQTSDTTPQTKNPEPKIETPKFNKSLYSTSEPTSLWMIVNKQHALNSSYTPSLQAINGSQMRPEASSALTSLLKDASVAGSPMSIISAYRSYANQQATYNNYVAQDGVAKADTYSARPGHSEHQTGLAVDLGNGTCNLEICFSDTKAGKWLAENAYKYGFIIRYPSSKTDITGYQYEPWHLRYVGVELSTEMQRTNILTLEEFFGVNGGTSY